MKFVSRDIIVTSSVLNHAKMITTLELTSQSQEQTANIGFQLGRVLAGGDVICLSGDLGAGKTVLAAGIGKGWGAMEAVNSPTFVLVHEHHRRKDGQLFYHLDCYRLSSLDDAATTGVEDMLVSDDIVVIEWPERIESLLPAERLWINLENNPEDPMKRLLTFQATGSRYSTLLDALQQHS
jgi:tRNA threonylcarbamoyladenosine biosynthesis protein TsaE